MAIKYIFLCPDDGVSKLLPYLAASWKHFFINRIDISRECIVRYNNDDADHRNLNATSVDIDGRITNLLRSDLLKDFDYVFSCSYEFLNNPPGLTEKQVIDFAAKHTKVHYEVKSNSRIHGQKTLLKIDVPKDVSYAKKPLEFFFAQEFLSQQHVDRDTHPELNIEIAEKFDLNNYNRQMHSGTSRRGIYFLLSKAKGFNRGHLGASSTCPAERCKSLCSFHISSNLIVLAA